MSKKENVRPASKSVQPVNRQYKDRLFRLVFEDKKDLLSLYNAVHGTDYQDPDDLLITTLEDAIYLGMKNDISFIIGATMSLYEQQSTWSENMPLRGLIYFAGLYQEYMSQNGYNLYGSRRITLPVPQYIVFYSGGAKRPDKVVMRLTDSFVPTEGEQRACLECEATILNINPGYNEGLLEKCRRLGEYAQFITRIRDFLRQGYPIQKAVQQAIEMSLRQGMLADVLTRCRTEVVEVLLTEYNEAETWEYIRREEREIAMEELRDVVKAEVRSEVEAEVRSEVEAEVRSEVKAEVRSEVEAELRSKVETQVQETGIRTVIETCSNLGLSREQTAVQLGKQYELTDEDIQGFMGKYWK